MDKIMDMFLAVAKAAGKFNSYFFWLMDDDIYPWTMNEVLAAESLDAMAGFADTTIIINMMNTAPQDVENSVNSATAENVVDQANSSMIANLAYVAMHYPKAEVRANALALIHGFADSKGVPLKF